MEIRLLTSLVSPDGSWDEGDVYTCDEGTAIRMIKSGQAVPVRVGGLELAVAPDAPEAAVVRGRRRRHA
jgi:hypothetical protein